ncbi:MAG TPA: PHP domain-containing protein [Candidatus Poseidoniales archaeon]|jgi:predicted metal-dependent phosphoesterase TrpH|nr:MAG: hypothetical protein CXT71_07690 [Euryarchaeota archaeon]HIF46178.1 PHP domain-containing protein [Candidatus Poseidoniales archaeon]HIL64803.1 PHP domain-containing protein [Candidatus Poseidoniales archaeon]
MWTESVDLHSHSHRSDGLWSPSEMARRAHANGVKVWSLTDHDTSAGWVEAEAECKELGLKFIPGVEITCEVELPSTIDTENPKSWHLLAYFPNGASDELLEWLATLKDARLPRMKAMLDALEELGHTILLADVEKFAEGSLGRPHLGRAMLEAGMVDTVQQAFDDWIGNDCPAFRSRPLPSIAEVCEKVRNEAGITSLAHCKYYGVELEVLIPHIKKLGVDCIEAFHHSHSDSYRLKLVQSGMPVTVGGDSHGTENRPSPGKMLVPLKSLHQAFCP